MKLAPNKVVVPLPTATKIPATHQNEHRQPEHELAMLLARGDAQHQQRHGADGEGEFRCCGGELQRLEHGSVVSYGTKASRACSAAARAVW